tara:strand:+ start:1409 stop:1957 length:549 start_codon:yes stop_codon:yes gene_type:complete
MSNSIHLDELLDESTGLSVGAGANAAEAAAVCFEKNGHTGTVQLRIVGTIKVEFEINWALVTSTVRDSHNDLQDATKDGAVGIAAICAGRLYDQKIVKQSWKKSGFDYHLAPRDAFLFQETMGYEISGILQNDDAEINKRVRQKLRQVKRGNSSKDSHVFVMEFSQPKAKTDTYVQPRSSGT